MKSKYIFEQVEIDDQIMAVPLNCDENGFHGVLRLNETASAILELLKEETTESDIVAELMKEYDGDQDMIASYVHNYVAKLIDAGIVE